MEFGDEIREAFVETVRDFGCSVLIRKAGGASEENPQEVRALKNSEKNRPNEVMFQFEKDPGIQPGDSLQQKGARDVWRVTAVSDEIENDVYIMFEAKVEKEGASSTPPAWSKGKNQVVIQGSVYGGVQVDSPHAMQRISIKQSSKIGENIDKLRALLQEAQIPQLDKEEAALAIDRVADLAEREKTPEILDKIKEKLDLVKSIFSGVVGIGSVATPYIAAIWSAIAG